MPPPLNMFDVGRPRARLDVSHATMPETKRRIRPSSGDERTKFAKVSTKSRATIIASSGVASTALSPRATRVAMWSVGNKSKFIPATTDAKRGLEKGLERATAAIARAPTHEWKPKAPDANLKSQWIVDAPRAGASDRDGVSGASGGIGAHLELEQMVSAGRRPAAASVGGESDSSDYASSSDESRSASRRKRRKKRRRRESSPSSGDSSDEDRDARARKRSRKKDAKGKKSKRSKKEKKSRKGKRKRRSASDSSDASSDASDSDDRRKVSAVSGERIKMKLEGTSRRDEADERRRQAYLRQLNATVDLARVSNAG